MSEQSRCQQQMRNEGKAYPRTCYVCGLGPCRFFLKPQVVAPPPEKRLVERLESGESYPLAQSLAIRREAATALRSLAEEKERLERELVAARKDRDVFDQQATGLFTGMQAALARAETAEAALSQAQAALRESLALENLGYNLARAEMAQDQKDETGVTVSQYKAAIADLTARLLTASQKGK